VVASGFGKLSVETQGEEPMFAINWLHLSDLHVGMPEYADLWPNVEESFFKDLGDVSRIIGGIDLVLFTGDLTYSGTQQQFDELKRQLGRFWDRFRGLGCEPPLFAVPGNHDLERPPISGALTALLDSWDRAEIQEAFWRNAASEYRALVDEAFANYVSWWNDPGVPRVADLSSGLLAGDAAAVFAKEGFRLGLVGLNSSFLQLADDSFFAGRQPGFSGKLALNVRQLRLACRGSYQDWAARHDVSLFLTHHPPDWLRPDARDHLHSEIAPAGRFAAHLFGHMHEPEQTTIARGGGPQQRYHQGSSLFGMESWGPRKRKRLHGYAFGQLRADDETAELRWWPRASVRHPDGARRLARDVHRFVLREGDGGTEPEAIPLRSGRSGGSARPTAGPARAPPRLRVTVLLGHSPEHPLPEAVELATVAVNSFRHDRVNADIRLEEASVEALRRTARAGCDMLLVYGHGNRDGSLSFVDGQKAYSDISAGADLDGLWRNLRLCAVFACYGDGFAQQLPCPWVAFAGTILREAPRGFVAAFVRELRSNDISKALRAAREEVGARMTSDFTQLMHFSEGL